ncbi:MAG: DUF2802 domain-containing protein [Candidatus Accumulibacter sp.]|jgi:hypothetical protein|nr:DUF2802 domain-containing protein [Accumulibacter sp.]
MDFEFLAYLGWRGMLIAVVVLLLFYVLFAFLRINRLRDKTGTPRQWPPGAVQDAAASCAEIQETEEAPMVEADDAAAPSIIADRSVSTIERGFAWNEPPLESQEPQRIGMLEQDLAQLRREIGGLRAEVQTLRDEQRRELSKVQQVAQTASPFYSDAMQLATQGREAADISVLCGISRAEAELVTALAKNRNQPSN